MDDLSQMLGIKYTPEQQMALKELSRRANDRLRVQNLLDEDYYVAWAINDPVTPGGRFLIPGKNKDIGFGLGQAVQPRYIAFKFFKEVSEIILDAEIQVQVKKENDDRVMKGLKVMDKTMEGGLEGEYTFVSRLKVGREDKLLELLPKIILGVEEQWGMDAIPYQKTEDRVKWDKVMDLINRPVKKDSSYPQGSDAIPQVTPSSAVVTQPQQADVLAAVI